MTVFNLTENLIHQIVHYIFFYNSEPYTVRSVTAVLKRKYNQIIINIFQPHRLTQVMGAPTPFPLTLVKTDKDKDE